MFVTQRRISSKARKNAMAVRSIEVSGVAGALHSSLKLTREDRERSKLADDSERARIELQIGCDTVASCKPCIPNL